MGSAAGTVRGWRAATNGARSFAGTHAGNRRAAMLATSTPSVAHRLRPAKVRSAVRRRWFEFEVPHVDLSGAPGIVDLGSPYGAWRIPGGLIGASWLCYCVGAGGDVSFDLELIHRYHATVRAFDAVGEFVGEALREAAGEPGFSAHHAALTTCDGPIRMQRSHDARSRSVSSAALYDSDEFIELPGRTLQSLMDELGDDHIDLLKLDVEGSEYELLPALDLRALGVKILAAQLHHTTSVARARALIAELRQSGYEPVACLAPVRLAFARRDLLEPRR